MPAYDLIDAIYRLDILAVKDALANGAGAWINNNNCKDHTLNRAIQATLSVDQHRFNLIFIKEIIDLGALPCNCDGKKDSGKNTLTQILKIANGTNCKREKRVIVQRNIIMIIKLLLSNGALPNNTKKPEQNTFAEAVVTGNLEIIKMMYEHGATGTNIAYDRSRGYYRQDMLSQAISTGDPEIVKYAIINGGNLHKEAKKPWFDLWSFDEIFKFRIETYKPDNHCYVDRMLNLMLCSGLKPKVDADGFPPKCIPEEEKSYIKSKMIICCKLLNPFATNNSYLDKFEEKVAEVRKGLVIAMKELVKENKKISVINSVIIHHIPSHLVDTIFEYYADEFIDWENIG